MAGEILRYYSPNTMIPATDGGNIVFYSDHLADKKAALEAQAEGHNSLLQREQDLRGRVVDAARRQHDKEIEALLREHAESDRLIATLVDRQAAELAALRGEGEPALVQFEHPNLIGEPCMIHRDYRPTMERLCDIAHSCDADLWVTHSMRRLNQKLVGAIVEQAERSNHHAGSACDLNVVCDRARYTSRDLIPSKLEKLAPGHPVAGFIEAVRTDNVLRWGGSFVTPDCVHFDDNLVLRDPAEWQRRVEELRDV